MKRERFHKVSARLAALIIALGVLTLSVALFDDQTLLPPFVASDGAGSSGPFLNPDKLIAMLTHGAGPATFTASHPFGPGFGPDGLDGPNGPEWAEGGPGPGHDLSDLGLGYPGRGRPDEEGTLPEDLSPELFIGGPAPDSAGPGLPDFLSPRDFPIVGGGGSPPEGPGGPGNPGGPGGSENPGGPGGPDEESRPVPEPSTLLLFCTGLAALAALTRRSLR